MLDISSAKTAYFLGWMYSDGCVKKDKNGYYTVAIKIHKKDEKVLELFKDIVPWRITYEKDYVNMRKGGKPLAQELISIGCLMRKSFENSHLLKMPKISLDLYPYFIRGFFDGDGYYMWGNKSTFKLECGIGNRNENILIEIQEYLKSYTIDSTLEFSSNQGKGLYRLRVRKNDHAKKFVDLIFKDKLELVLERKYIKVKEFIKNFKTVSQKCKEKPNSLRNLLSSKCQKHVAQYKSSELLESLEGQSTTK